MAVTPHDGGRTEKISLDSAATHILEECRMVLPGIQVLFGFQLIAVFSDGFAEKLSSAEQLVHLAAMVLVVVSIALIMAPAALHRQTQQQEVSERFISVASNLLLASMFPLVLGVCVEVYLVSVVIAKHAAVGVVLALALAAVFALLWLVLPRRERARRA
jgi:hypothetical protein